MIAIKFCRCHDICAVVTCTKYSSNIWSYNRVTLKPIFHGIWIMMEKSFVKWAPWFTPGSSHFISEFNIIQNSTHHCNDWKGHRSDFSSTKKIIPHCLPWCASYGIYFICKYLVRKLPCSKERALYKLISLEQYPQVNLPPIDSSMCIWV